MTAGRLALRRVRVICGTRFERIDYACREANGSMKPVTSMGERLEKYCSVCTAEKCLLRPGWSWEEEQAKEAEENRVKHTTAGHRGAETLRGLGLGHNGKPLVKSCWNCTELRQVLCEEGSRYRCRWEPKELPRTMWTMMQSPTRRVSRTKCKRFELRLVVEIPVWDENDALGSGEW